MKVELDDLDVALSAALTKAFTFKSNAIRLDVDTTNECVIVELDFQSPHLENSMDTTTCFDPKTAVTLARGVLTCCRRLDYRYVWWQRYLLVIAHWCLGFIVIK